MYFFHAPNGRMLALAGLRTSPDTATEVKKGGLVVREIRADHSLGDSLSRCVTAAETNGAKLPPLLFRSPATVVSSKPVTNS